MTTALSAIAVDAGGSTTRAVVVDQNGDDDMFAHVTESHSQH